jgi:hypothetical protein
MVWQEKRGENYDILATRVNALNVTVWPPRTVCGAAHRQRNPVALPDHAGGVVVVWLDERNGLRYPELYAQRLNSSGTPLWTPDGVPLAPGRMPSVTDALDVAPDGSGGVLVAWVGEFYPSSVIFAQRVSGAGAVEWESDGLQVCVGAFVDGPSGPHIASDGGSGAFIGWTDGRSGSGDVYAQHVSGTGVPLWTLNGIPVCPNGAEQGLNAMVSDGSGGVLFGWSEWPAGIPAAYAHRVDGDGNALWPGCGVALCNSPASQGSMRLAPDGAGGAIALWEDLRVPGDYDIYGQRVDASGNLLWPAAGAVVCAVEAHQFPVALTSDGSGGALALWSDSRPGAGGLYAQRIGSNGVALWTTDGVPVHTGTPSAEIPGLAPDGSGGAYAVWQKQHPPDGDILYSLRLTNAGAIASGWLADGIVPVLVSLVSARVERGIPRLSWHLGGASLATATVYRAAPAAAWEAVGAAMADGMGRLSYDDETVEPGRRYGYRLGVRDGGAEVFGGEVWIDVPSNAGPALAAASPTLGGHDGLRVEFDLPDAGPARLELHDLAGRLLSALEVGGLGPGHHAATLGPPGGLPPGIYLLRLTRGGRSLTARAAVLW